MTKEDIIKAGAGALLTTIATVLFAQARVYFDVRWILLSLFALTANFAIYAGIDAYRRTEAKHQDALDTLMSVRESLENLELTIKSQIKFTWLLSAEQLQLLEYQKEKCRAIWVILPDPSEDTGDSPWVPVIRNNLKDGIKYTYICLNSMGIRGAINGLKDTFRGFHDLCDIALIDIDEFERFPYRHIVIYDPNNDGGEMDCYAEIIAPERGCWLQLARVERHSVIDRATVFAANAKCIKST